MLTTELLQPQPASVEIRRLQPDDAFPIGSSAFEVEAVSVVVSRYADYAFLALTDCGRTGSVVKVTRAPVPAQSAAASADGFVYEASVLTGLAEDRHLAAARRLAQVLCSRHDCKSVVVALGLRHPASTLTPDFVGKLIGKL